MPRFRSAIVDAGLDATVAVSAPNVNYTGGVFLQTPTLVSAVLTTGDGAQTVIVNAADANVFRASSSIRDVRSFQLKSIESSERMAADLIAEALQDHGLIRRRVGIDAAGVSWRAARELTRVTPTVQWSDADAVFESARLIKTPGEIALLSAASHETAKAIAAAVGLTQTGETERGLATRIQANLLSQNADAISKTHVQFGSHATVAHAVAGNTTCQPGDILLVDVGGCFLGYHTDVARNAAVSPTTRRQRGTYASLVEIRNTVLAALKPGTPVTELASVAQAEFRRYGLCHPWETIGHSIGLALHEGFELSAGTDASLEPGMVLAIDLSHIETDKERYKIEDVVVITKSGSAIVSASLDPSTMSEIP